MPRRKRRSTRHSRAAHALSVLLFAFSTLFFLHQHVPHLRHVPATQHPAPAPSVTRTQPTSWFSTTLTADDPVDDVLRAGQLPVAAPQVSRANDDIHLIPHGPYPLPPLSASNSSAHAGTAWTASLARGVLGALPLHWLAELTNAPPAVVASPSTSIFSARRKGAWIGCERPYHLVCKGVYRAIKRTNAVHVVDVSCANNVGWLPHVIRKLRAEFRLVRLTCLGAPVDGYEKDVTYLPLDPFRDKLPNTTEMLVAYKFVEPGTLISAMRFFKNVKRSAVDILVTENFPDEENVVRKLADGTKLRINTGLAPFWFPAPEYEYENEDENVEDVPMGIVAVRVAELFEESFTPGMNELVDPRKRRVLE